jgi:antitoxin component YwqK of YwqJK toxin-antitoxin module
MKNLFSLLLLVLCIQFSMAQFKPEDGPYKRYHDSGELMLEGQYKDGKRVGEWIGYHKNGQISNISTFNDGKKNIPEISYYEDGALKSKIEKKGDIHIEHSYYKSGELFFERAYKSGYYKEFTEEGVLKVEANYRDFNLYGKWKEYHKNGEVKWSVNYEQGYRNGIYEEFYDNGQLKVKGVILNEKKKGEEKRYDKNGNLVWKGHYENDEFVKTWIKYDEKGKKIKKINTKREDVDLVPTEVPDGVLQKMPVFPGCSEVFGNIARKKCMNQNVAQFIVDNFNTDIASDTGLSGRQRIYVSFKVDKDGYIGSIKIRAPHPRLRIETKRIMEMMPRLDEPGFFRGKPVVLPFSLPIVFQVE